MTHIKRTSKNVNYGFTLSKEKINQFKDMSGKAKLDWLEDANRFIRKAVSPEKLKLWNEFRRKYNI